MNEDDQPVIESLDTEQEPADIVSSDWLDPDTPSHNVRRRIGPITRAPFFI
jgi:hypothetical protein